MAQSGYTPILIYASGTATNVPLAANLTSSASGAELALNYADGKLYYKNGSGVVTLLASTAGASGDVVGPASSTDNALARFDLTTGKLIQNSVGILSDAGVLTGLTGITSSGPITLASLTAGRVTYAGTAGLLVDSANLTFNGTDLTVSGAVNAGSINATTLDLTNLEVTNIKAKDGTASIVLADTTGIATFSKATVISTTDNTNAALRITQLGTGDALLVEDSTNPDATPFVIDAAGRVLVGNTTVQTVSDPATTTQRTYPLQINGADISASGQLLSLWNASTAGPRVSFGKSRSAAIGTYSIVSNGDDLGVISFAGDDGAKLVTAASILADVDGTPGTDDMPGRLVFSTTADGASTPTERIRITSAGNVGIGTSSPRAVTNFTNLGINGTNGAFLDLFQGGTRTATIQSTTSELAIQGVSASQTLTLYTNATERMRIDSSGNVGIGTSSPASIGGTLSVVANASTGIGYFRNLATSGMTSDQLQVGVSQSTSLTSFYFSRFYSNVISSPTVMHHIRGDGEGYFAGSVGIGTSSPAGKLHVNGGSFDSLTVSGNSTNSVAARFQNSAASARNWNIGSSGGGPSPAGTFFIYDDTASATRMVIDSSGNVGIGLTPSATGGQLQVNGAANSASARFSGNANGMSVVNQNGLTVYSNLSGGSTDQTIVAGNTASTYMAFGIHNGTSYNERMRIDSSGNLLVGATSQISGERFSVTAGATNGVYFKNTAQASFTQLVWNSATSGDNSFIAFGTEGTYTGRGSITYNRAGGLVAYNVTSDYRAKDIYGPVTGSGALIDSVPVYMGKMKGATQERPMFIAHEVPAYAHTGVKDAVDADGKPVYQQMDASALIPVMWAEIQSLRKRLAAAGI